MTTRAFYASLPVLTRFEDLTDTRYYADAPADWYVLVTDVVGSTEAILAGRYREVNVLGAGCIMAVLNVVRPLEIPFVFGGDGASILVPPDYLAVARDALLGMRFLAQAAYGLELRVGVVPVSNIQSRYSLKVARFRQAAPSYSQASFIGGGMSYATDLVKTDGTYRIDITSNQYGADLRGLECRWQPLRSPQGQVLTLIVVAQGPSEGEKQWIYRSVLRKIQQIYGPADRYHPVATSQLKLSFNPWRLGAEVQLRAQSRQLWHRLGYSLGALAQNLLGSLFMNLGLKVGQVDWRRYRQYLRTAADYQKIDDSLRMVIAGSPSQTERLQKFLDAEHRLGHLSYGSHSCDRALLTCLIIDRRTDHLHFVDGADGGYTLAAQALKRQQTAAA